MIINEERRTNFDNVGINGDGWPFLILCILFFIPYIFYNPTILFPLDLSINRWSHIFISLIFFALVFFVVRFGFSIASDFFSNNKKLKNKYNVHNNNLYVLFLNSLTWISIYTHIYLLIVGGSGYIDGGFIEARDSFLSKGIGIPLRFYLISIPISFLINKSYEKFKFKFYLLIALVFLRSFILSERMAMLELMIALWYCAQVKDYFLDYKSFLKILIPVIAVFYITIEVRLIFQSQYDEAIGQEGFLNTLFLYYADTTNKFYLTLFYNLEYPLSSWDAIFREFSNSGANSKTIWDESYLGLTAGDSRILLALNNPGGFAQDVSDFGVFFGLIVAFFKIFICAFVIRSARYNVMALSVAPLIVIQVIEYNRFNYLYLPYGIALLLMGVFGGCVAYIFGSNRAGG